MGAPDTGSGPTPSRRRFPRRLVNLRAQVILPGNRSFDVRLVDVGEGGLGIVASANPSVGTAFTIRFTLPGRSPETARPIEGEVRVANSVLSRDSGGFKIGLQFTSIDDGHLQALRSYTAG